MSLGFPYDAFGWLRPARDPVPPPEVSPAPAQPADPENEEKSDVDAR